MQDNFNGNPNHSGIRQMHYTLFVPLTQNDGSQQPIARIEWVEGELVKRAGGLTRYYPGHGLWVPPMRNDIYRDVIIPFHVVTPEKGQTDAWLVDLAAEIAQVFEQTEIFVFEQPVWLLEHEKTPGQHAGITDPSLSTAQQKELERMTH